jgi:hypothetical protein
LDRQRNDHLGRSCFRPDLFEHRRQILRAICFANAHSDCNGYGDTDAHLHCDCHSHCNAERDTETYSDAKG